MLKRIFGRFWYLFAAGIMLALFLTFATRQDNLNVYTGNGRSDYTMEPETEKNEEFISQAYVNNTVSLQMKIPDGWTYVVKDGYDTFVHAPTASSIQIQVISYYPMVNNATQDSLYATYQERGYNLTEYQRLTNCSYYCIYQSNNMDGIIDYIEYVLWDRQHVVKILATFNDANYQSLGDKIWSSFDSIEWAREDPIADGVYLSYSSYGDFEFAVPVDWATAMADNTFYASLEGTNAAMTVDVLEDTTMMENFSQIDYSNYLSNGRSNFAMTQFQQDSSSIYAEATHYINETQMSLMQYYLSNGVYHYIITYECPTDMGDQIIPLARDAMAMTRVFYTPSDEELQLAQEQNETEAKDSVFTPDSGFIQAQSEIQANAENMMDNTDQTSEANDGNASSFADALVTVADIPLEKAETISNIWTNLGISTPTYAEAIKGNDQMLIVMITDSSNINYYIYMTRSGDLTEIHMNSEDGPTISF